MPDPTIPSYSGYLPPNPSMLPEENPSMTIQDIVKLLQHGAPNIASLVKGEPAPPMANLPETPGKVPGTEDPRIGGAVNEAGQAALAALPLAAGGAGAPGMMARALTSAPRRAIPEIALSRPGAAGVATGLLGSSNEADAAPRLTRAQQQALEIEKQRAAITADAALKAKRGEADIAATSREQELASQRANEKLQSERPFRERYPDLSTAMSGAGMGAAAMLPYGSRAWQTAANNKVVREWLNTARGAEQAALNGNKDAAKLLASEAQGFLKQPMGKASSGMPLNTASAVLPIESSMIPEQIDLASGSQASKDKAKEAWMDPLRIPAGLATGATFATLGAKAPLPFAPMSRGVPEALTQGLVRELLKRKR